MKSPYDDELKIDSPLFRVITMAGWWALTYGTVAYLTQNYQASSIAMFISSGLFMLRDGA